MSTITVYMSSIEPQVTKYLGYDGNIGNIEEDNYTYTIPLTTNNKRAELIVNTNIIGGSDDYVKSIWDKNNGNLSWERTVDIVGQEIVITKDENGLDKIEYKNVEAFRPAITIKYTHPAVKYLPHPYWKSTVVDAKNPDKIIPHSPFIIGHFISDYEVNSDETIESLASYYLSKINSLGISNITEEDSFDNLLDLRKILDEAIIKIPLAKSDISNTSSNSLKSKLQSFIDDIEDDVIGILKTIEDLSIELIDILDGNVDIWLKKAPDEISSHYEAQPIVRPGEYIKLTWNMYVNGVQKSSVIDMVPYETPLFTGGKLISKQGEGTNIKYIAEIFGKYETNIIPTDFFDYEIGKWAYFIKNVNLEGEHQKYGNGSISVNSSDSNEMLELINDYRIDNRLDPLFYNTFLETSAEYHANDMANNNYFSHQSLDGKTVNDRILATGYFDNLDSGLETYTSENIKKHETTKSYVDDILTINKPSIQTIFDSWLDSPSDKANILSDKIKEVGFAFAFDEIEDYGYYVQDFGYREDGVNINMPPSEYRLTPFNFKGPMSTDMAINYRNELEIDSATNFEKVFDMIRYEAEIKEIDSQNDKAKVLIDSILYELPIFYHCTANPITEGGSKAFSIGDQAIIEKPKDEEDWDNAYIIGLTSGLKKCKQYILVRIKVEKTYIERAFLYANLDEFPTAGLKKFRYVHYYYDGQSIYYDDYNWNEEAGLYEKVNIDEYYKVGIYDLEKNEFISVVSDGIEVQTPCYQSEISEFIKSIDVADMTRYAPVEANSTPLSYSDVGSHESNNLDYTITSTENVDDAYNKSNPDDTVINTYYDRIIRTKVGKDPTNWGYPGWSYFVDEEYTKLFYTHEDAKVLYGNKYFNNSISSIIHEYDRQENNHKYIITNGMSYVLDSVYRDCGSIDEYHSLEISDKYSIITCNTKYNILNIQQNWLYDRKADLSIKFFSTGEFTFNWKYKEDIKTYIRELTNTVYDYKNDEEITEYIDHNFVYTIIVINKYFDDMYFKCDEHFLSYAFVLLNYSINSDISDYIDYEFKFFTHANLDVLNANNENKYSIEDSQHLDDIDDFINNEMNEMLSNSVSDIKREDYSYVHEFKDDYVKKMNEEMGNIYHNVNNVQNLEIKFIRF